MVTGLGLNHRWPRYLPTTPAQSSLDTFSTITFAICGLSLHPDAKRTLKNCNKESAKLRMSRTAKTESLTTCQRLKQAAKVCLLRRQWQRGYLFGAMFFCDGNSASFGQRRRMCGSGESQQNKSTKPPTHL
jgi:hypothetical protein